VRCGEFQHFTHKGLNFIMTTMASIQSCRLFALPAELRPVIYEMLIGPVTKPGKARALMPLLKAYDKILSEAMPILKKGVEALLEVDESRRGELSVVKRHNGLESLSYYHASYTIGARVKDWKTVLPELDLLERKIGIRAFAKVGRKG
jgi:hypothetical protein